MTFHAASDLFPAQQRFYPKRRLGLSFFSCYNFADVSFAVQSDNQFSEDFLFPMDPPLLLMLLFSTFLSLLLLPVLLPLVVSTFPCQERHKAWLLLMHLIDGMAQIQWSVGLQLSPSWSPGNDVNEVYPSIKSQWLLSRSLSQ
ncbi:hypothetical protein XENORESO_006302 [Xenotaenia resolanae]|uniref:NADH dehydrogenase subunit 4 n=1 Tax=Xenotaenia resolanae TaxID=208358 RepID=A0ABV0W7C0_9TELE